MGIIFAVFLLLFLRITAWLLIITLLCPGVVALCVVLLILLVILLMLLVLLIVLWLRMLIILLIHKPANMTLSRIIIQHTAAIRTIFHLYHPLMCNTVICDNNSHNIYTIHHNYTI